MDPRALALVLTAALCHAAWNLRLHRSDDGLAVMAVAGVVGGLLLLPFVVASPPVSVLPRVGLSALAEAAYGALLAAAYSRGALAVTYPVGRGVAPMVVTLGGVVVLGQTPAVPALLGALLLAGGLAVVGVGGHRRREGRAVLLAVAVGCAVAGYSLIDAGAVRLTAPLGYLGAVLLLQAAVLAGFTGRRRLLAVWRPGVLVGVGSTLAYSLVLLAFQLAPAGRVATLREVAVVIGVAATPERRSRALLTGALLVSAGAILAGI